MNIGFDFLENEYSLLETGLSMVSYEQSLWIYQRWLMQVYRLQSVKSIDFDPKKNIFGVNLAHDLAYGKHEDYVLNVFVSLEKRQFLLGLELGLAQEGVDGGNRLVVGLGE